MKNNVLSKYALDSSLWRNSNDNDTFRANFDLTDFSDNDVNFDFTDFLDEDNLFDEDKHDRSDTRAKIVKFSRRPERSRKLRKPLPTF